MFEFIRYVLFELQYGLRLAILAVAAAGLFLLASWWIHKRKYKGQRKFPFKMAILWILLVGYAAVLIYATILRGTGGWREWNLHLFRAWVEAWNTFSAKTWANVLLNVAMFAPLGILLPLMFKLFRKWCYTIPMGFVVSLGIEMIQLGLARGIFDVDDLFANTLGTAIGFFLIMSILALAEKKGHKWRRFAVNGSLFAVLVGAICMIFVIYALQPYGNLQMAAAYRNDVEGITWTTEFVAPDVPESVPLYKTQPRTVEDCDRFAEVFRQIVGAEYTTISYYEEAAYYMDQSGDENGTHFLHVHYLDPGYEYTFRPWQEDYTKQPAWTDTDRKTLEKLLEKLPLMIPESAEFSAEGDGWHSFTVCQEVDGAVMMDGTLRCRYAADGTVREVRNDLLSYTYHETVSVISPEEACELLMEGWFNDEGWLEHESPDIVEIISCVLVYEIDTKGYYQPVYRFELSVVDGSYENVIMIPAMK